MPPPILSSAFLNLNTINSLLNSPVPPEPEDRIRLLTAKVHLLLNNLPPLIRSTPSTRSNAPSREPGSSASSALERLSAGDGSRPIPTPLSVGRDFTERDRKLVEISQVRIVLARARLALSHPDYISAEAELSLVERDCRYTVKRHARPSESTSSLSTAGTAGKSGQGKGRTQGSATDGNRENGDEATWLREVRKMRIEALHELVRVEERLGREGRVERWRKMLKELE
ncbi:hypothetical protein IAU60_003507 [Kwoniella sp. DSM 27419]